jgi:hypothetical protein
VHMQRAHETTSPLSPETGSLHIAQDSRTCTV